MSYKNKTFQLPIENVISQRLKLQSTQNALLREFHLSAPSLSYLSAFANSIDQLPEFKRLSILEILGGKVNIKKTAKYLKDLKNGKVKV